MAQQQPTSPLSLDRRLKHNPGMTKAEEDEVLLTSKAIVEDMRDRLLARKLPAKLRNAQKHCLAGLRRAKYIENGREPEVGALVSALSRMVMLSLPYLVFLNLTDMPCFLLCEMWCWRRGMRCRQT